MRRRSGQRLISSDLYYKDVALFRKQTVVDAVRFVALPRLTS